MEVYYKFGAPRPRIFDLRAVYMDHPSNGKVVPSTPSSSSVSSMSLFTGPSNKVFDLTALEGMGITTAIVDKFKQLGEVRAAMDCAVSAHIIGILDQVGLNSAKLRSSSPDMLQKDSFSDTSPEVASQCMSPEVSSPQSTPEVLPPHLLPKVSSPLLLPEVSFPHLSPLEVSSPLKVSFPEVPSPEVSSSHLPPEIPSLQLSPEILSSQLLSKVSYSQSVPKVSSPPSDITRHCSH
ncbi:hypothetical protein EDD21DRAFT_412211 [Dissophora ornata]|nr:hypothetical protein EDD21DRAFT_412211 [Dissophora ornata]